MSSVAIYLRTNIDGPDAQAKLDAQYASCLQQCELKGLDVSGVKVFQDTASGMTPLWERDGLTGLREGMKNGDINTVVVHSLDRISRNSSHQAILFTEAKTRGVKIVSATEEIDDTPIGKMMDSIISAMAEIERDKLRERSMRGKAAAKRMREQQQ